MKLLLVLAGIAPVVLTRVVCHNFHWPAPTIAGFRTHHYMFGVVIAVAATIIGSPVLAAVGSGLIIDEIPWLIGYGYTSNQSLVGVGLLLAACICLVVVL